MAQKEENAPHQVSGLARSRPLAAAPAPAPGMTGLSCDSELQDPELHQGTTDCSMSWISAKDKRIARDLITSQFKEPTCGGDWGLRCLRREGKLGYYFSLGGQKQTNKPTGHKDPQ